MAFDDPWLRNGQRSPIEFLRRRYAQKKNACDAWRALQICAELGDSLPPWLVEYVRASAAAIQDTFNEFETLDVPTAIAAGLGFTRAGQGVRTNAFTEDARALRDLSLVSQVHGQKQKAPTRSIAAIKADVAERHNVSIETMNRAWSTWNAFLTEHDAGEK